MSNLKFLSKAIALFIIIAAICVYTGCGVSSDPINGAGLINNFSGNTATLRGRVAIPESGTASIRKTLMGSLIAVQGAKVYLEDNINIYGIADENGYYVINNVPLGEHKLIAKISNVMNEVYMTRSAAINVTTSTSADPIAVEEILYPEKAENYVTVNLIDSTTNQPLSFAEVVVWGEKKTTDAEGKVTLGPLPDCENELVSINKAGYNSISSNFDFTANNNSETTIKLNSFGQSNTNRAPITSILCDSFEYNNGVAWLKKDTNVTFKAKVKDPDNDSYDLRWEANIGSISSNIGDTASYYTPNKDCLVVVTLTATDINGGVGQSVLKINIGDYRAYPATGTQPIATGTYPIATGTEPIATDTSSISTYTPPVSVNGLANVAPANHSFITSVASMTQVTFKWTTNATGSAPIFFLYTGRNASALTLNGSGTTNRERSALFNSFGDYYWQIWMFVGGMSEPIKSDIWHFNIGQANRSPNVPVLSSPVNNEENVILAPSFVWRASDPDGDTVYNDLYLSDNSSFNSSNLMIASSTANSWKCDRTLMQGKKYYWKIISRDIYGLNTSSSVYSFTTLTASDTTPPEVLSVNPANNSNLDRNTSLTFVFNEGISYADGAFVIEPEIIGAWITPASNTVTFYPVEDWLRGINYNVVINRNKIRDDKGNVASGTYVYSYSRNSGIFMSEGYHSIRMPYDMSAGEVQTLSIASYTSSTGKVYAVVVADEDGGSANISAKQISSNNPVLSRHLALRKFEKNSPELPEKLRRSFKYGSNREPLRRSIGDERNFYVLDDDRNEIDMTTTLVYISDHFLIYQDTELNYNSTYPSYSEIAQKCEDMLGPLTNVFGNFPTEGVDGESKISLVFTRRLGSGICGYFYSRDCYPKTTSPTSYYRYSNECKVLYMTMYPKATHPNLIYQTAGHEMQHMINFNNLKVNNGPSDAGDVWLNEGLSVFAEDVLGYGEDQGSYIKGAEENISSLSLTSFDEVANYGLSYLFVKYLSDNGRYGNTDTIIKKLAKNDDGDIERIESITGEDFQTTLGRWGMAMYINDYRTSAQTSCGINGLNLSGTLGSVNLPGFAYENAGSVGTVNLKENQFRGFIGNNRSISIRAQSNMRVFLYFKK